MRRKLIYSVGGIIILAGIAGSILYGMYGNIFLSHASTADPLTDCQNFNGIEEMSCWHDTLVSIIKADGVGPAFSELKTLYQNEERAKRNCHSMAHDLGNAAYGKFRNNPGTTNIFAQETSFCAYGFYHGFMEGFVGEADDLSQARTLCERAAEKLTEHAPDARLQCYHGIGHGAIDQAVTEGDLIDDIQLASEGVKTCEKATQTEKEIYRCVSGVYNGIANLYIREELGMEVNPKDPVALCGAQPEKYREACLGNMNSVLFWLADNDFSKADTLIKEHIAGTEFSSSSVRYLSGLAIPLGSTTPMRVNVETCRALNSSLNDACVEGLAHGHLEHGTPGVEYEDAITFCGKPFLRSGEQNICFSYVAKNMAGWYGETRQEKACALLPEQYRSTCQERE